MSDIPQTPFDDKIRDARAEAVRAETALKEAQEARWDLHDEIRALADDGKGASEEAGRLRAELEGWAGEYTRADELRLRAKARLTALESARERYLLQEHDIFPSRPVYGSPEPAVEGGDVLQFPTRSVPAERSEPIAAAGGMKSSADSETK